MRIQSSLHRTSLQIVSIEAAVKLVGAMLSTPRVAAAGQGRLWRQRRQGKPMLSADEARRRVRFDAVGDPDAGLVSPVPSTLQKHIGLSAEGNQLFGLAALIFARGRYRQIVKVRLGSGSKDYPTKLNIMTKSLIAARKYPRIVPRRHVSDAILSPSMRDRRCSRAVPAAASTCHPTRPIDSNDVHGRPAHRS